MNNSAAPVRRRPLVAMRALRRLVADPERTGEVFVIVRNLSGDAIQRSYRRFCGLPGRREWLEQSLLTVLGDRDHLRTLPADSLGRAYLDFVERESLSADGLVEASEGHVAIEDLQVRRFAERNRDMHDLWHVLSGYGRDAFGEVCLLAFTYAQTRNLGIGVIALVGALKIARERGFGVFRAVWQGYRAGRRAAWLPGEHWESLLAQPLADLRKRLGITPPSVYRDIRQPGPAQLAG